MVQRAGWSPAGSRRPSNQAVAPKRSPSMSRETIRRACAVSPSAAGIASRALAISTSPASTSLRIAFAATAASSSVCNAGVKRFRK